MKGTSPTLPLTRLQEIQLPTGSLRMVRRSRLTRHVQHRRGRILIGNRQTTQQMRRLLGVELLDELRIVALTRQMQQDDVLQRSALRHRQDRFE